MIGFVLACLAFAIFVFFIRPSKYLFKVVNREFNPTPQEQELRFYRRGQTYNAIGGLKGTHAAAFAWTLVIVLPLAVISAILEAVFNAFSATKKPSVAVAQPPSEVSEQRVTDQLAELARSHERGEISDADFASSKAQLMIGSWRED